MTFIVQILIAIASLTPRLGTLAYMAPEHAALHAAAAQIAASETKLEPELLLAVAWVESRFDSSATSRVERGGRRTGSWPSSARAGRGPRFCGVMQTIAGDDWAACLAQRPLLVGYRTGAAELRAWLRLSRGDLRAALNGHGCGVAGMTAGCRGYADRVLAIARRLRVEASS